MVWTWIDLEMTGLGDDDQILEVAMLFTTPDLEVLSDRLDCVVACDDSVLDGMDDWCQTHHTASGLVADVKKSQQTIADVEEKVMDLLMLHTEKGQSPLCGNSIATDRRFIAKYMPRVDEWLHYRMIDVSTLKVLHRVWTNDASFVKPESAHRAMADIQQSIIELQYYQNWMFGS